MMESRDPNNSDDPIDELDEFIDSKSIPEQVAMLEEHLEAANVHNMIVYLLVRRLAAAGAVGVLKSAEMSEWAKVVFQRIQDLRASLVLMWSPGYTDREVLEQLHTIYFPRHAPSRGLNYTLDDHLFGIRQNIPFDSWPEVTRSACQITYWKLLRELCRKASG